MLCKFHTPSCTFAIACTLRAYDKHSIQGGQVLLLLVSVLLIYVSTVCHPNSKNVYTVHPILSSLQCTECEQMLISKICISDPVEMIP